MTHKVSGVCNGEVSGQPSATVTMLFSDMEGSTALLAQLGDEYAGVLSRQRALLRAVWQRWGGHEMGTEGDSFFVTFRTASDAVSAALQAQREVQQEEWTAESTVRLRMGLHTGEPLDHDGGYVGMDVHRAARIAAVAHGGQVLVSEATRQLVMGRLPAEAGLLDLGLHQLKDISAPEHLYQLTAPELEADFPRLKTIGSTAVEFRVLGPLEATRGSEQLRLGGPKQQQVLAALLLEANRTVSASRLVAVGWGPSAAPGAVAVLKRHITALRRTLQPDPGGPQLIQARRSGFVLQVDPEAVDMLRFDRLATEARKQLADEHYDLAARGFAEALQLWRGEPLAGLVLDHFEPTLERLRESRLTALEDRIDAELGAGHHSELVNEIDAWLDDNPLRERLWAQLMLSRYRIGQPTEALAVFARAEKALQSGGASPGPDLRDLVRRIRDRDSTLDAPAGAARPKVKLPVPAQAIIGRAAAVSDLRSLLRDGRVRLLTLTGAGGVGKTRLAVEVSSQLVDQYPGGVFFIPLAAVTDPALVVPAVASTLEVQGSPDEPLIQSLSVSLGTHRTLLVLDNLEQVPDAAAVVADILAAVPAVQIVATSRSALRIDAEREHPVPPLDAPEHLGHGQRVSGEAAGKHAAVELFVSRSRAVCPGFELDDDNAAAISEICVRLDGLPLAIELAAARSVLLSPAQLLGRLGRQLTLLTSGRSDLPSRQRTLRATIDWSHDLLTDEQQRLLARLGAFTGPFSLEAAEMVAGSGPDDGVDVLDGLVAVVGSSLVRRLRGDDATGFRLLESVQEYARERLAASGEETLVRRRLAEHVLERAETAQRGLDGSEAPQLLAQMRSYDADLRGVLEWGLRGEAVELAATLAATCRTYWLLEGRLSEGRLWLGRVLERGEVGAGIRGRVHLAAGILAYFQDDVAVAHRDLTVALELARAEGDDERTALSLGYLGVLELGAGKAERAQAMADEASAISDRVASYEGQALALSLSAVISATRGDLAAERQLYLTRLELARRRGDCRRIAETLGNLADIASAEDNNEQARTYAEEALKLARGVARMSTRDILLSLGRIELATERLVPATGFLEEALRLSLELGQEFEAAQALVALGAVASTQGDHARAARLFGAGDRLHGAKSPLEVDLEPDMSDHRVRTRDALGQDAFHVAQLAGAALSRDEIVTLALTHSGSPA